MFTNYLHFPATQLSATSTSRAAFMQCLRWGAWCPFQEPDAWKGGGEVQLVLRGGGGGTLPNPYGVMVYSAQTAARTPSSAPISAADGAQVKAAAAAAARARVVTKIRSRMSRKQAKNSSRADVSLMFVTFPTWCFGLLCIKVFVFTGRLLKTHSITL